MSLLYDQFAAEPFHRFARSELERGLNLLNLLVPADPPPPILPLPQYTIAPSVLTTHIPPPIPEAQAYATALTFATKTRFVSEGAKALSKASERAAATAKNSRIDWAEYVRWRDTGYRVEARGAGPAASLHGRGSDQTAKQIVAVVGADEMQPAWRAAGLAYLGNDKASSSGSSTQVPERPSGKRRLKVVYHSGKDGSDEYISRPTDDFLSDSTQELLDEDLFAEVCLALRRYPTKLIEMQIMKEAQRPRKPDDLPLKAELDTSSIILPLPEGHTLSLSLVSPYRTVKLACSYSAPQTSDSNAANGEKSSISPARIISAALRLRLFALSRSRKAKDTKQPAPLILQPIMQLLAYRLRVQNCHSILSAIRRSLLSIGLEDVAISKQDFLEDASLFLNALAGLDAGGKPSSSHTVMLGGTARLLIGSRQVLRA